LAKIYFLRGVHSTSRNNESKIIDIILETSQLNIPKKKNEIKFPNPHHDVMKNKISNHGYFVIRE